MSLLRNKSEYLFIKFQINYDSIINSKNIKIFLYYDYIMIELTKSKLS